MGNVPIFHEMAPLNLDMWHMVSQGLGYSPGFCEKDPSQKVHQMYNRRVITGFSSEREVNHIASS